VRDPELVLLSVRRRPLAQHIARDGPGGAGGSLRPRQSDRQRRVRHAAPDRAIV